MRAGDFHFDLPEDLIAQEPLARRDQSRLLVLERSTGELTHSQFIDLDRHLRDDDVLVLNNSRVIRARLRAVKESSGGRFEVLLVEQVDANDWWALMKPGKRAPVGTRLQFLDHQGNRVAEFAQVIETNDEGHRRLLFHGSRDILLELEHLGEVPLPPYIRRSPNRSDLKRYQTVFAQTQGSVAAPTAGLHFTEGTLDSLRRRGIRICELTLHVGLGTFAPVKAERLEAHPMHEERFDIPEATARQIGLARRDGRRVVAVGTTTLRALESAHTPDGVRPGPGRTRLFVYPPFKFRVADALLTNFHLPSSTLLMLVCAFAAPGETRGRDLILKAYTEAVRARYRFFSYGDAMLIL
jgi:S-adenosylmethionine:tRNA ribosyltransferase-isomerase